MTRRAHRMPFGADVPADGGVTFNFYAPDVSDVDLAIEGRDAIRMQDDGGWKRAHVADARAGDLYRFRLRDGLLIPDPASRFQPLGVTGPSQVVDPCSYEWRDDAWLGRPWSEAILYEAHIGTATTGGAYAAFAEKLDKLAELGVTAVELMPLAQWRGARNWGYDGVLPFAPACAYGGPDDLKALIDHAHALGIMIVIDVVYNHFGPSGNYLHSYARSFFTERHATPWGAAINFDDDGRDVTRAFFVHNARYWIDEFNVDGLRFDAVHAICDDSERHILREIADEVRAACPDRRVHLILENDLNQARWLERDADGVTPHLYTAQWNDDAHHCWHTLLTGEHDGYYAHFAHEAPGKLAQALIQGFVRHGEPSAHLHPAAFIDFLQNHDQIGNRAFGERIDAIADPQRIAVARAALLLSPHIPLLFMGEEWGATSPFLYFVDFEEEPGLAQTVRDGRRREFEGFAKFGGGEDIPDPNAPETFNRSHLDLADLTRAEHADSLERTRALLRLRREHIIPLLATRFIEARGSADAADAFVDVQWLFEGGRIRFAINLGLNAIDFGITSASAIYKTDNVHIIRSVAHMPPWSLLVLRSQP